MVTWDGLEKGRQQVTGREAVLCPELFSERVCLRAGPAQWQSGYPVLFDRLLLAQ